MFVEQPLALFGNAKYKSQQLFVVTLSSVFFGTLPLGSSVVNVSSSRYKHWQYSIQSSSSLGRKNGHFTLYCKKAGIHSVANVYGLHLNFTVYKKIGLQCRVHCLQFKIKSLQFEVYRLQSTVYSLHFGFYCLKLTVYSLQVTGYRLQFVDYILHCTALN